MAAPLAYKQRVRLPEALDPPEPRRPRVSGSILGSLGWVGFVALCWVLATGSNPLKAWSSQRAEAAPLAEPVDPAPARPASDPVQSPVAVARTATPLTPVAATAFIRSDPTELRSDPDPVADEDPTSAPDEPQAKAKPKSKRASGRDEPSEGSNAEEPARPLPPIERAPSAPAPAGVVHAGRSCEQVQASANQEIVVGSSARGADLPASAFASVLNNGRYLAHCSVPEDVRIEICAAIRDGRAEGVTVRTTPHSSRGKCVAQAVRRLRFPVSPHLDIARTVFKPAH